MAQFTVENQELFLGDKRLEDNQTVESYNIGLHEKIRLVKKYEGSMQVYIKDNSKSTAILSKPSSTVFELKQTYELKSNIPVNEQRLIHRGKQLVDYKKLSDYGITHGSFVTLFMRLNGGL
ncbi:21040_t:CDS:2 [Cetraspora pellucida]|uniref:21040_t:CDS:1 n=1 Tax=Cetraspora pellucida TaxID=1433469 RepID=A0A9N8VJP5_9GLOM|nr:21040_t:CDS:2 [Cetraspora pellucida]